MKCEQTLVDLECGGPLRRLRARCHAMRCPRCAAVRTAFGEMKRRLAVLEPLSPEARRAWERASGSLPAGSPRSTGRRVWVPLTGGLAAAFLAVLVVGHLFWWKPGDVGQPPPSGSVVEVIDPAEELTQLATALDALDAQVRQLKEEAGRQTARRAVASAIDRFGRW
jgi:hypothetical protein